MQDDEESPPLYFPLSHPSHKLVPFIDFEVPEGQDTQEPFVSGPSNPALQMQSCRSSLLAGEELWIWQAMHLVAAETVFAYCPAGHSAQEEFPTTCLKKPLSHAVHGPPSGP
jgi:hypothetical protein